jgi:tetratricopeptide (TPR) repeat protein
LVNEQKTIEAYEAALKIEPEDAVALYNNIDALSMQEGEEEAMELLCQAWRNRKYLSDERA